MTQDSFKKKFITKVLTNLLALILALVSMRIVSVTLGPKLLGDYSYLNSFFLQLFPLFTLGTSYAFYTKYSARIDELQMILFYGIINMIALVMIGVLILFAEWSGISQIIWSEIDIKLITNAALFASFSWLVDALMQIGDARGDTVRIEVARIVVRLLGILVLILLYYGGALTLSIIYVYNYFLFALTAIFLIRILILSDVSRRGSWSLSKSEIGTYAKEFYIYTKPLFLYALVGIIVTISERWLLQFYGGSIQQGYFSLAFKIGAICFVFSNAATQLIMRDFSIAFEQKDLHKMKKLFRQYVPVLYSVAAGISCFVVVNAGEIVYLVGGTEFESAAVPAAIMALYPMHQTYGQLSGSVFYATGSTLLYSSIGIVSMFIGLVISYISIAPVTNFGLDIGATGLALKFVLVQVITVNVQLYFNSRVLNLNFRKYVFHQVAVLIVLMVIAILVKISAFSLELTIVNLLFLKAVIYFLLLVILLATKPRIFGLNRKELSMFYGSVIETIKGKV